MCTAFEPRQYQQVQVAYRLLGKSQVSILYSVHTVNLCVKDTVGPPKIVLIIKTF